jgi:hypothetical protein
MENYTYEHSEPLRFALANGSTITLVKGKTYALPADNAYIAALEAKGYLKRAEAQELAPKPRKRATSKNS